MRQLCAPELQAKRHEDRQRWSGVEGDAIKIYREIKLQKLIACCWVRHDSTTSDKG